MTRTAALWFGLLTAMILAGCGVGEVGRGSDLGVTGTDAGVSPSAQPDGQVVPPGQADGQVPGSDPAVPGTDGGTAPPADPDAGTAPPDPTPGPSPGPLQGIPALPDFVNADPSQAEVISGSVTSLPSGHWTCNGGTLTGTDAIELTSDTIVRDCHLEGRRYRGSGNNIAIIGGSVRFADKTGIAIGGTNLVIDGVLIEGSNGGTGERHGVQFSCGSNGAWLVSSELVGNSGDGFQSGHQCGENRPTNLYLGNNVAHDNRENGFDTKYVENVVYSGNLVYNHAPAEDGGEWCWGGICSYPNSGSDGAAIIVGSDGGSRHVWLIGNDLYDNGRGIRIEEGLDPVLLDNSFANTGQAIVLEKGSGETDPATFVVVRNNPMNGGVVDSTWRDFNFCIEATGNTDITFDLGNQNACADGSHRLSPNDGPLPLTDLEARFESRFGFAM